MTAKTALFDAQALLELDGLDDHERLTAEPNPYWNRARLEIIWNLPVMSGMVENPNISLQSMRLAKRDELRIFHNLSYIETLELFGNTGSAFSARMGLDTEECPIFHDVDKYASLPVGAAIDAVRGVAKGEFKNAMSFFGGLHHAFESRASGFCYYNDIVVAIKHFREEYPNKRVLYLDTDAHHGDGTQGAFYTDPNVLTISLHEYSMGFFPGTGIPEEKGLGEGEGYSVNIPLPPLTDDVEYWNAFEELVIPIWLTYKPDFVFWVVGADAHMNDPLTDFMLTFDSYRRLALTIKQLVHLGGRKLVMTGGGGYDPVTTAKIWTMLLSDMSDAPLPPTIPAEWLKLCENYFQPVKRATWTDRPMRFDDHYYPRLRREIDETIKKVKEIIFPTFNLEK